MLCFAKRFVGKDDALLGADYRGNCHWETPDTYRFFLSFLKNLEGPQTLQYLLKKTSKKQSSSTGWFKKHRKRERENKQQTTNYNIF